MSAGYWRQKKSQAGMILFLALAIVGCGQPSDSGVVSFKVKSDTCIWLADVTKEPAPDGNGEVVRIECDVHNGSKVPIGGLKITDKSCGCFEVELDSADVPSGSTSRCSVLLGAVPSFGREVKFTIAGQGKDSKAEIPFSIVGAFHIYLLPEWAARDPRIVLHSENGAVSSARLIIDRFTKKRDAAELTTFTLGDCPKWARISNVTKKGYREIRRDVHLEEYDVEIVADSQGINSGPRNGTFMIMCGEGKAKGLTCQYQIVNHDPCFEPHSLVFDATAVGTSASRTVKVVGASDLSNLKFVSNNDSFSAKGVELKDNNLTSPNDISVEITFSPLGEGSSSGDISVHRLSDDRRLAVLTLRGKGVSENSK